MKALSLQFTLDEDSLQGAEDLLGSIWISDGTSAIGQAVAYLDSWFAALIEAVHELRKQGAVVVEMLEEPSALEFAATPEGLCVRYGDSRIQIANVATLAATLRMEARNFIAKLQGLGIEARNDQLQTIEKYAFESGGGESSSE